jgi:hypothetical protein
MINPNKICERDIIQKTFLLIIFKKSFSNQIFSSSMNCEGAILLLVPLRDFLGYIEDAQELFDDGTRK